MLRTLTAEQARAAEEEAVRGGTTLAALMESAGLSVARVAAERGPEGLIVVLAGCGNNGGDGWVAAHDLKAAGRSVSVRSLCDPGALTGIAADAARAAIASGVEWEVPPIPLSADNLADAAVVIDALLGTGSKGAPRAPLDSWIDAVNASGAFVVSVDIPSGVDSDTGAVAGAAVIDADCTVTFSAPKLGLVLYPGAAYTGELIVSDIGMGVLPSVPGVPEVWDLADYAELLPIPAPDAHKNSRGRVLVVAGSRSFPGAAVLAARGSMRSGAGYVRLAVPASVVPIAQSHLLAAPVIGLDEDADGRFSEEAAEEVLGLAEQADAVVLGPGLTRTEGVAAAVREIAGRLGKPLVLDADALNVLAEDPAPLLARQAATVLTPHPGELGRLLGRSIDDVQRDRLSSSAILAAENRVVVLKGAGTVVSGSGRQVISMAGTAALATAGTGDVLSGVIGALLAQGLGPLEAAALGVELHGLAGEQAEDALTRVCVTAEDVPEYLPGAVAELLRFRRHVGRRRNERA
ncbi:MAG: NAD(P)H-hydrate dehydratase [Coriobacteriia bacterium]